MLSCGKQFFLIRIQIFYCHSTLILEIKFQFFVSYTFFLHKKFSAFEFSKVELIFWMKGEYKSETIEETSLF